MTQNLKSEKSKEDFGKISEAVGPILNQIMYPRSRPKTMGKAVRDMIHMREGISVQQSQLFSDDKRHEESDLKKSLLMFSTLSPKSRMSQANYAKQTQPFVKIKQYLESPTASPTISKFFPKTARASQRKDMIFGHRIPNPSLAHRSSIQEESLFKPEPFKFKYISLKDQIKKRNSSF